jgi:hypothetical protein
MAFPGGGLISFTPYGGSPYLFTAYRTGAPVITPTSNRSFGKALGSPYPVNRDAAIAPVSLRLTWKVLALSNLADPYTDLISQLDQLWQQLYFGPNQIGVVVAWTDVDGGNNVSFTAAVVPGTIALLPQQPRHNVHEVSFDCLSPFE